VILILHSAEHIYGFTIAAKDDELGKVEDIYFDDETLTMRYLVANTRKWLPGKSVLISPAAFEHIHERHNNFSVALTKEQVKNSPDIDASKPISRQQERNLMVYYGWAPYWGGAGLWGPGAYPTDILRQGEQMEETHPEEKEIEQEAHLRSAKEVKGYSIQASNEEFGHVDDFIIEEDTWKIRYLVIDTKNWWFGKKVLISPDWIKDVSWGTHKVYIDLPKERIKQGPEYDPNQPITPEFEQRVHNVYHKQNT
jgi:uncharacterized protein YrrD